MFQESKLGTDVPVIVVPSIAANATDPDSALRMASVRHMVFGPLEALRETTKTLYIRGYAEVNDWSQPQPTSDADEFVTVLIKKLRLG